MLRGDRSILFYVRGLHRALCCCCCVTISVEMESTINNQCKRSFGSHASKQAAIERVQGKTENAPSLRKIKVGPYAATQAVVQQTTGFPVFAGTECDRTHSWEQPDRP